MTVRACTPGRSAVLQEEAKARPRRTEQAKAEREEDGKVEAAAGNSAGVRAPGIPPLPSPPLLPSSAPPLPPLLFPFLLTLPFSLLLISYFASIGESFETFLFGGPSMASHSLPLSFPPPRKREGAHLSWHLNIIS